MSAPKDASHHAPERAVETVEAMAPPRVKHRRHAMPSLSPAEFAAAHPLLSLLSADARAALLRASSVVSYRRGDSIWHLGHHADVFVALMDGVVAQFLPGHTERPLFVSLAFPGELLDLSASVRNGRRERAATAYADPTRVLKAPRGPWLDALRGAAEALHHQCELLAAEQDRFLRRLALSAALAPTRLAHLLLELAETIGATEHDAVVVPLRLTREHMAQYIGSTPETVTRTLTAWSEEGIVEKSPRALRLRAVERLRAIATSERPVVED
jgi:CRP-like cAMP-binding protein